MHWKGEISRVMGTIKLCSFKTIVIKRAGKCLVYHNGFIEISLDYRGVKRCEYEGMGLILPDGDIFWLEMHFDIIIEKRDGQNNYEDRSICSSIRSKSSVSCKILVILYFKCS